MNLGVDLEQAFIHRPTSTDGRRGGDVPLSCGGVPGPHRRARPRRATLNAILELNPDALQRPWNATGSGRRDR